MAAPCGIVRADSSDEEPPRLCCSDDSECEDNVLRQPQAPQPPHAQHAEQLHTLHDDNDSMPELVSGESSENEAPVRGQATNRLASLSTGEDHADSDGWTTAEDEEAEGAHMIEGDVGEGSQDEYIEEDEDEYDPDADSDSDECWCPACTSRRLQGTARSAQGHMAPANLAGLAGMPRQSSPRRGRGRAGQIPDVPPPGFMSAAELMMGALQSDEGISSHPLLRQFAPMSEPHSPAASAGKPPVEDLPLQRHRRRLFEMQDLLYGARPPASLKTLLAQDGYVKQVLSRLPGVDPESPTLQALAGALKTVCTHQPHGQAVTFANLLMADS